MTSPSSTLWNSQRRVSQGKKFENKKLSSCQKVAIQMVNYCSWVLLQSQMVWQRPRRVHYQQQQQQLHMGVIATTYFPSATTASLLLVMWCQPHYHSTPAGILLHGGGMKHWKIIYFGGDRFDKKFDIIRVFFFLEHSL